MNIINPIPNDCFTPTQIEHLEKEKHEIKHLGTIGHRTGHTLFSFNHKTHEIKRVVFDRRAKLEYNGEVSYSSKVTVEQHCYYAEALNERNFIKHLNKKGII